MNVSTVYSLLYLASKYNYKKLLLLTTVKHNANINYVKLYNKV